MSKVKEERFNFCKNTYNYYNSNILEKNNNIQYFYGSNLMVRNFIRDLFPCQFFDELFINEFNTMFNFNNKVKIIDIGGCNVDILDLSSFEQNYTLRLSESFFNKLHIWENAKIFLSFNKIDPSKLVNMLKCFDKENITTVYFINQTFSQEIIDVLNEKNFDKIYCCSCKFNENAFSYKKLEED